MLTLKKYFTDGLMQMAILLSLCGVRVDVGLESYLHEIILGPTSLLTQTPFHNFRNRLEDGQGLHPKSLDLDQNFWTQTLRSWICSSDRLQIPRQELVSWLVHQVRDPAFPEQTGSAATERNQNLREPADQDGMEEEMQSEERGVSNRRAEDEDLARRDQVESAEALRELNQPEFQHVSAEEDMHRGPAERNHNPRIHTDSAPSELDLQWRDLLGIVTPQTIPTSVGLDLRNPLISHEEALGPEALDLELESGLLPLIPSVQLDDHSSTPDQQHISVTCTYTPPDHSGLLYGDLGLSPEDSFSPFDMNLLQENLDPAFTTTLQLDSRLSSSANPGVDYEEEFDELLQDAAILGEMGFLDLALEEGFTPEMVQDCFNMEMRDDALSGPLEIQEQRLTRGPQQEAENEMDSDSGLSLDFSYSPPSPCVLSVSYGSSTSSPPSAEGAFCYGDDGCEEGLNSPDMEAEVTIKQEQEEEEIGAVGGSYSDDIKLFSPDFGDCKVFNQWVGHDHTYNQPWRPTSTGCLSPIKPSRSTRQHVNSKHSHSDSELRSRDERRARILKIPFSNELIIHLPVEEFNDLLAEYQLTEDQLSMVRDIRRRGKNKIAAQNCRQRKLGILQGLEGEISALRHRRRRLLRNRQEALRNLKDMQRELAVLYSDVFSSLRDEEGRPLDSTQYHIHIGPDETVAVESYTDDQSSAIVKTRKKQRDKRT